MVSTVNRKRRNIEDTGGRNNFKHADQGRFTEKVKLNINLKEVKK